MKYNKDTGNKILTSAITEFEEKGYSGARMQSIANRAGINKALLHYYYKSKDALFQIIMKRAFNTFMPEVVRVFNEDLDIFTTIEIFTATYIDSFINNPRIPGFITQEINHNPDRLLDLIRSSGVDTGSVKQKISKAVEEGHIIAIQPEQLMVNIISLCLFPFVAKPIVTGLILEGDNNAFDRLINARKKEVAQFIINAIKREKIQENSNQPC